MTITLLLNSEGSKMGKTAKGAVWLDPNKTSPLEFYQYWRNIDDADVMKCIRLLTFIPVEEIEEMERWDDSRINEKKELLAYELTAMIHGKECAAARNGIPSSTAMTGSAFTDSFVIGQKLGSVALGANGNLHAGHYANLCVCLPVPGTVWDGIPVACHTRRGIGHILCRYSYVRPGSQ